MVKEVLKIIQNLRILSITQKEYDHMVIKQYVNKIYFGKICMSRFDTDIMPISSWEE